MPRNLLGCQIFLAVSLLLQLTAADSIVGIYPDVSNCFKGFKRTGEKEATDYNKYLQDDCQKKNLDQPLVCIKLCMAMRQEMLGPIWIHDGRNYTVWPQSAAFNVRHLLGIDYNIPEEELNPESTRVAGLVAKCHESSFLVEIHEEYLDCKMMVPHYWDKLQRLINCFDDALKC